MSDARHFIVMSWHAETDKTNVESVHHTIDEAQKAMMSYVKKDIGDESNYKIKYKTDVSVTIDCMFEDDTGHYKTYYIVVR